MKAHHVFIVQKFRLITLNHEKYFEPRLMLSNKILTTVYS